VGEVLWGLLRATGHQKYHNQINNSFHRCKSTIYL
jgi:hypothetical protein